MLPTPITVALVFSATVAVWGVWDILHYGPDAEQNTTRISDNEIAPIPDPPDSSVEGGDSDDASFLGSPSPADTAVSPVEIGEGGLRRRAPSPYSALSTVMRS